jgi:hypothetical protein
VANEGAVALALASFGRCGDGWAPREEDLFDMIDNFGGIGVGLCSVLPECRFEV